MFYDYFNLDAFARNFDFSDIFFDEINVPLAVPNSNMEKGIANHKSDMKNQGSRANNANRMTMGNQESMGINTANKRSIGGASSLLSTNNPLMPGNNFISNLGGILNFVDNIYPNKFQPENCGIDDAFQQNKTFISSGKSNTSVNASEREIGNKSGESNAISSAMQSNRFGAYAKNGEPIKSTSIIANQIESQKQDPLKMKETFTIDDVLSELENRLQRDLMGAPNGMYA